MNNNNIIKTVMKNTKGNKFDEELLRDIENAMLQLQAAREFFETVNEPRLIDYAIYMEEAAKARYSYLISEAKRVNLKNTNYYIFNEMIVI